MTSTPNPLFLEELAEEYATIQAQVEPLVARQDEIKKHFRQLSRGTHDIGGLAVTVSRNARLNTSALSKTYTPDTSPELYETKISTALVREHLDEEMIDGFTTEGDPKVSVKL